MLMKTIHVAFLFTFETQNNDGINDGKREKNKMNRQSSSSIILVKWLFETDKKKNLKSNDAWPDYV